MGRDSRAQNQARCGPATQADSSCQNPQPACAALATFLPDHVSCGPCSRDAIAALSFPLKNLEDQTYAQRGTADVEDSCVPAAGPDGPSNLIRPSTTCLCFESSAGLAVECFLSHARSVFPQEVAGVPESRASREGGSLRRAF